MVLIFGPQQYDRFNGMALTLWDWERALAPRGSNFTNAKLQRRRATASYPTKKRKIINATRSAQTRTKYLPDHHFLPIIAWICIFDNCSWSSHLVPSDAPGQSFLFICLSHTMWLCLKKCSENRVLVVLLQSQRANNIAVFIPGPTWFLRWHEVLIILLRIIQSSSLVKQYKWLEILLYTNN